MKAILVLASFCLTAVSAGFAGFGGGSAGFQSSNGASGGYSDQSSGFNSAGNGGFSGQFGSFSAGGAAQSGNSNSGGGTVRRFVSVHVAPELESVSTEPRIIRAGGAPDTHYNIIFVKAPSNSNSQQQTEVILPEPPAQKTLVYVLVKRPDESQDNVKIRAPTPTKPAKPEVYFIRYKPESDRSSAGPAGGTGAGDASGGINSNFGSGNNGGFSQSLSGNSAYGPPPQRNAPTSLGGYQ